MRTRQWILNGSAPTCGENIGRCVVLGLNGNEIDENLPTLERRLLRWGAGIGFSQCGWNVWW